MQSTYSVCWCEGCPLVSLPTAMLEVAKPGHQLVLQATVRCAPEQLLGDGGRTARIVNNSLR